jgi:hypothetical protein
VSEEGVVVMVFVGQGDGENGRRREELRECMDEG